MIDTQERRLIAVDCDGMLFDDNGYPSQRTHEVIQCVLDSGHHIVAVTGRSRFTACNRLEAVPGMRHLVCSNGAYAWDMHEDRLDWETEITQEYVAEIVQLLRGVFSDVSFSWKHAMASVLKILLSSLQVELTKWKMAVGRVILGRRGSINLKSGGQVSCASSFIRK